MSALVSIFCPAVDPGDGQFVTLPAEMLRGLRDGDLIAMERSKIDETKALVALLTRRDAGPSDLPAPRLQLRWESPNLCHYELVIPLREHDIRRESDGKQGSRFLAIPINATRVCGTDQPPLLQDDRGNIEVRTPYRDGSHIRWDAAALNLPAFAIWQDRVTKIESAPPEPRPPADELHGEP